MRKIMVLTAAVAVCGCYAQFEDSSVAITRPLCAAANPSCIPGGGLPMTTVQIGGKSTVTVPLGDQDLFKPETDLGPAKLISHLVLNQVTFEMTTQGCDFKGIAGLKVLAAPRESTGSGDDPCAAPTVCPVLAEYSQATQGPADQKMVLNGTGADLIEVIDQQNHQLVLELEASGVAPGNPSIPQWGANVTLDTGLSARVNYP